MTHGGVKKGVLCIDEYLFAKGVGFLIGLSPRYKYLGSYESPEKAIENVPHDNPDLIIMEVDFPFENGLKSIGRIREIYSWLPIVVISANLKKETIAEAFCLGANGFVSKSGSNVTGLVHYLDKLECDGFVMSSDIARSFTELIRNCNIETPLIINN